MPKLYAFCDEISQGMNLKNTYNDYKYVPVMVFACGTSRQYQPHFCFVCGDYTNSWTNTTVGIPEKIMCCDKNHTKVNKKVADKFEMFKLRRNIQYWMDEMETMSTVGSVKSGVECIQLLCSDFLKK